MQARDKTTQSWMDRRFSVGEDTCKHRRWIFFWRSYMFSTAGAKIIKEDLQRSPMDSICCATQEKHWERPLHWLEGGLEQPAQKLSSSVWFLLIWLQEMGTVCHLHERYSHNKEMPYSMVNFSLGWIQVQISGRWHVWKELSQWLRAVCLHFMSSLMKWLGKQNQNFQGKETQENKVLGI